MKRIFLLLMIAGFINLLMAQDAYYPGTTISPDVLKTLKSTFESSQTNIAAVNAVSHNEIKKLALSRENAGKVNHYFSHTLETKGITNQNKSGRCWLYTGLNKLRPMVREKYELGEFEFSQTYNFFYDQLEKANLFFEAVMATYDKPLDDREVEWLLENSWGADKGHKGYLTMTDEWFNEYMFMLVVNKKYLDNKTLNILEQEAILLPPWDPVFAMEE